ncbi:MAG: hypothetical protein AB2807_04595 [Candidatus Sedimenticola endophacoides]
MAVSAGAGSTGNRRGVLLLAAAAVTGAAGLPGLQVNHSMTDSLARGSGVRAQVEAVNQRLAGLETFSVMIDSGIQDTFLKVRYLEEIQAIQDYIAASGLSRSTTSFTDYLALLNRAFQELEGPQLPLSDAEVNELMIFLDHRHVKAYVSEDYSTARILVRHNIASTRELQGFVDDLNRFIADHLEPGLRARVTGSSVLTLSATGAMIEGQLQSILLLFFVIIMSLLFTDPRVGLLAALPNAFPVLVLFGVMGYAGIPLNIVSAPPWRRPSPSVSLWTIPCTSCCATTRSCAAPGVSPRRCTAPCRANPCRCSPPPSP